MSEGNKIKWTVTPSMQGEMLVLDTTVETEMGNQVFRELIHIKEEATKKALIALGWTPPEGRQGPASPFEHAALIAAGRALDSALMEMLTNGSVDVILHPELVDRMHQALNRVVAVVGTPWRDEG